MGCTWFDEERRQCEVFHDNTLEMNCISKNSNIYFSIYSHINIIILYLQIIIVNITGCKRQTIFSSATSLWHLIAQRLSKWLTNTQAYMDHVFHISNRPSHTSDFRWNQAKRLINCLQLRDNTWQTFLCAQAYQKMILKNVQYSYWNLSPGREVLPLCLLQNRINEINGRHY